MDRDEILRANRIMAHGVTVLMPFALANRAPSQEELEIALEDALSKDCPDDPALWPHVIEWVGRVVKRSRDKMV